ncbi:HvfC/BufC N-terminal domain-containing protein, partial [Pseudomonas citronellolis]|uniref:HvfC/BufC N-terminal domain-containing protein n=1 Tax=Pseudomonas citronellolis TaxID=53408 RepID=UPI0023E3F40B
MNDSLADFQDAFVDALYRRPTDEPRGLAALPGFAVYRNTVFKGCVDALRDNFPSVERLVGADWFDAAAARYARQTPPDDARLILYGATFADFLADFEPARALPYLADVARLDYLWLEAFGADREDALALADLAGLDAAELATRTLRPRVGVRWRWFPGQPIYSLWRYNREGVALPETLPWHGEGALLVGGPRGVTWQPLDAGACAFLDACAAGADLDRASALALETQADLDFTALLGRLLAAAVFAPLTP